MYCGIVITPPSLAVNLVRWYNFQHSTTGMLSSVDSSTRPTKVLDSQ